MRVFVFALLMFLIAATAQAAQPKITTALATDHIDITAGFTGARLSLFGTKEGEGDVAIVVQGPQRDMTVRRKDKIAGAWMNRSWVTFKQVPVYYSYAASAPLENLANEQILKANHIGLDSLEPVSDSWASEQQFKEFRAALIRNRQKAGLIAKEGQKVNEIGHNFFRVDFDLPANVHPGNYQIRTFYFSGGTVRDVKTSYLRVANVGISAQILDFARGSALSYGLLCVFMAAFAGWFSNRIRRRA